MTDLAISIIIPTYNGVDVLPEQLDAIIPQLPVSAELILADNGSTDSINTLAERYAERCRLRLVDSSRRRGSAAARNIGAAEAVGDVLLFVDQDDEVADGWLHSLLTCTLESGLAVGALPISVDWTMRRSEDLPSLSQLRGTYGYLPFGMSSNMGLTRSVFEALGGFDETFVAATDVDLCWRAQELGIAVGWCDDAVVRKRSKLSGAFAQHRSYGRDDVLLYVRHRDSGMRRCVGLPNRLAWAVTRVPLLYRGPVRRTWLRTVGRLAGRIEASLSHRSLYL